MKKSKKKEKKPGFTGIKELGTSMKKNTTLYIFLILPIIYFVVFKYIPMFGNIIAFRKYVPGQSYFGVSWEGFRYFEMFLKDEAFWNAFKNTVVLSGISLLICFPIPIIFSLLLNELMQKKFKKSSAVCYDYSSISFCGRCSGNDECHVITIYRNCKQNHRIFWRRGHLFYE